MTTVRDFPKKFVRHESAALGRIDEMHFVDTLVRNVDPEGTWKIPQGTSLYLRGWALAPDPPRPGQSLVVSLGPDHVFEPSYGMVRPDIGSYYGNPNVAACGFIGIQPLAGLEAGQRELVVGLLDGAGGYFEVTRHAFELLPSKLLIAGKANAAADRIHVSIDDLATLRDPSAFDGKSVVRARIGDVIYVRGWSIDREAGAPLGGVYGVMDGSEYVIGVHGLPRPDAAEALGLPGARRCGFTLRMPTRNMKRGAHRLELAVLTADGSAYHTHKVANVELAPI